jgi:hypothetical protein
MFVSVFYRFREHFWTHLGSISASFSILFRCRKFNDFLIVFWADFWTQIHSPNRIRNITFRDFFRASVLASILRQFLVDFGSIVYQFWIHFGTIEPKSTKNCLKIDANTEARKKSRKVMFRILFGEWIWVQKSAQNTIKKSLNFRHRKSIENEAEMDPKWVQKCSRNR